MSVHFDRNDIATIEPAQGRAPAASPFRNSPRNQAIRRRAFRERARERLPNLESEIENKAAALYGIEQENLTPRAVEETLERRAKFYDWFADGKPAEVVSDGMVSDGEISAQFARCWQTAVKVMPNLQPVFALREDGFRVPLPHGFYRFNRSVLLNPGIDDGADQNVEVDARLLRKGGLYRFITTPQGSRLESLDSAMPRWKIALRMLRRYRASVRPEILRRYPT